ncbi:hypothetical protein GCM10010317_088450 [Streptomyces mirabilis]|nr:hypothetical protein GCM10010317_088450 [Streptomyces mirabilis]
MFTQQMPGHARALRALPGKHREEIVDHPRSCLTELSEEPSEKLPEELPEELSEDLEERSGRAVRESCFQSRRKVIERSASGARFCESATGLWRIP